MIKRRFYRLDHSNRDAPSGSDSSSSDSYLEAEASDDESHETEIEDGDGDEEENVVSEVREKGEASSSSGYQSEDSSVNEVNLDSSGLPTSDEDVAAQNGVENMLGSFPDVEAKSILAGAPENDEKTGFDAADCVIKCKSVFKCRLCPRIVCLSEDTIKAHLSSKRHARSEKLRKEGRLKLMLDEDGKLEGEIPDDNDGTTTFPGQKAVKPNKRGKGRGKLRKRSGQDSKWGKAKRGKKRRNDD